MARSKPSATQPDATETPTKGPRTPRAKATSPLTPAGRARVPVVELLAVGAIRPLEGNARAHPPAQLEALARSIHAFGFVSPVLVDAGGRLIAGHARLEAAKRLGMADVPAVRVEHLNEEQVHAYAIADNRLAELAEWDDALLARELRALEGAGLDLEATGFTSAELHALERELLAGANEGGGGAAAAEEEDKPAREPDTGPRVAREGDLWTLGRHRYLVGDCRDRKNLARLCPEGLPELCVTDPPYCSGGFQEAARGAGTFGDIASDGLSSRGFRALISAALEAARPRELYAFADWRQWPTLFDLVESLGLPVRGMLVWDKGRSGTGPLWRCAHELVLFASRRGGVRRAGEDGGCNVLRYGRSGNKLHYTEKPVDLLAELLRVQLCAKTKTTAVLDLFAGSAPLILAAERCELPARCIDVEPRCADAALLRWRSVGISEPWLDEPGRPTWSDVARARGVELEASSVAT